MERRARSDAGVANHRTISNKSHGGRRYRGLTCANCRARKVRCEGGQPSCKTCEIYHDECRYDKTPPISQVVAMAKRLQEAERALAELRAGGGRDHTASSLEEEEGSPAAHADGDDEGAGESGPGLHNPTPHQGVSEPSSFSPEPLRIVRETPCGMTPGREYRPAGGESSPSTLGTPKNAVPPAELSVDEHGSICYYGPTSAVHDPPPPMLMMEDTPVSQASTACPSRSSSSSSAACGLEARTFLASYGREAATWEEFALGNAALETGIPRQIMAKLLHLHWTWVSPMFMWVYRPAFVRDMATGGRYYSDFLLTVICAHAAKYQDGNCAELLLTRARRLLGTAIQQPSSIPTVQALLQLSARDLAHGSISQAWVYSGIAFRMASDLGLQHTGPDIRGMGPVDLEVRRRLFWSCYFWDKATSLYAGRLPAVTEILHLDTLDMLDDSMELETWSPYYGDSLNLSKLTHNQYPHMVSHSVSCFVNSCRLSIIINDIIVQLYSRRSRTITEQALKDIKTRLDRWRAQSPAHLSYDPDNLPPICPPPHLISQNLLYFASVILAHRPFWSVPAYYRVCIHASRSIEKLVLLLESTFGLENITYLMGYCIYTGASAILEDAKNGNDKGTGTGMATLRTFLRALNTGMRRCPLLERSLNIIVRGLNRPSAATAQNATAAAEKTPVPPDQGQPDLSSAGSSNGYYIPAFPYLGGGSSSSMPVDFDMDSSFLGGGGGANMDSMVMLDCYPEMQMDMGELMCPPLGG